MRGEFPNSARFHVSRPPLAAPRTQIRRASGFSESDPRCAASDRTFRDVRAPRGTPPRANQACAHNPRLPLWSLHHKFHPARHALKIRERFLDHTIADTEVFRNSNGNGNIFRIETG